MLSPYGLIAVRSAFFSSHLVKEYGQSQYQADDGRLDLGGYGHDPKPVGQRADDQCTDQGSHDTSLAAGQGVASDYGRRDGFQFISGGPAEAVPNSNGRT